MRTSSLDAPRSDGADRPPKSSAYIELRGIRENNLKNVSLRIPKRQITVFTGVSGAGKSSLVFDTIAAESQRQLNELFTAFARNRLPTYGPPDADGIAHLSAAVIIDQKPIRGNARSTVGTITDVYSLLRLLFSRVGRPHAGYSNAFSFNDPEGMCPACDGVGETRTLDLEKLLDTSKSLNEGPFRFPGYGVGNYHWEIYAHSGLFDNDKKLADYTDAEWEALLHGPDGAEDVSTTARGHERDYEGLADRFARLYIDRDIHALGETTRAAVGQVTSAGPCPACDGTRLSPAALRSTIGGYNIAQLAAMEVSALVEVMADLGRTIDDPAAAPIVSEAIDRLRHFTAIGLGYLSLDRKTPTLSGGESQRIKMVKQLGSSLTDMTYIFDEPTVGLHPRDVGGLIDLLRALRDDGNTVLVVEHDRDVIEMADHVVDIGPGAGAEGGEIVYQGDVAGLHEADTLTGRYLRRDVPVKSDVRQPTGWMTVADATLHNLNDVTVDFPRGVLTAVTGVAGAGKSSLIDVFLDRHPEAIAVDQSPVGTSIRSVLATYTGLLDTLRRLFAEANDVSRSLFSFNSEGACPACEGRGLIETDLAFMDPVQSTCEACGGRRFKEEVLRYTLRGHTISDVLAMTAGEAHAFFEETKLRRTLQAVNDVGLGYLRLGQPLSSLSGGECQRIKLASELHKTSRIYVLDEPTTGLHMSDIDRLIALLNCLVDRGNSVVVIEHNLDVVKHADWVIDLGPESGRRGGTVVFEGPPQDLIRADGSLTGDHLWRSVPAT